MKRSLAVLAAALLAAGLIPQFTSERYVLHLMITAGIYVIAAWGLNVLVGYTGYVSFAQAAFYGLGAYSSAYLVARAGLSFWVSLPLTLMMVGAVAVVVGYPPLSLKVKGSYFSLVTMALNLIVRGLLWNLVPITGGPMGFSSIPAVTPIRLGSLVLSFGSHRAYFYLVLAAVALVGVLCIWLVNSRVGRVLVSIREDEVLADSLGAAVTWYKVFAFAVTAMFGALGGSLLAHYGRFLGPDMFGLAESVDVLAMVIVGGSGTLVGPAIGAVLLTLLPEYLRSVAEYRNLVYSLLLIVFTMTMPSGIAGMWRTLTRRVRSVAKPAAAHRKGGAGRVA